MTDQMENVKPAGVMNNWYLSLISPTVDSKMPPTPAPDPAMALKAAVRIKVASVRRIKAMLSGE